MGYYDEDEISGTKIISWIIIIILAIWGIHSCIKYDESPEGIAAAKEAQIKKDRELKACRNNITLVSEINGVQLYSVKPNCYDTVYFSESGTQWEEHVGKHYETKRVPNTGDAQ